MKKLKFLGLVFLTLALVVGVGVSSANAALTLEALTITSSGALTLEGAAASVITVGALNTGGIAIGNGATIKTISLGAGNAVNTIKIGDNATPINVITLGGAASLLTVGATIQGASPFVFEGLTANTFELTFAIPDVSADATITFPDVTGTLATLAGTETLTNKTLTSPILTTPALGTPSALVLTSATGLPAASVLAGSFGAGAFVISTSLQAATIELAHATANTLSASGGVLSIEGVNVVDVSSAQTLTTKTLTAPIINGATSASGNFDLSGSTGTFLTSTGINTIGGATVFAANKGVTVTAGTSAFDFSGGSGIFKTSTGLVTVGPGAVTVSGATTFSAAGTALTVTNNALISGNLTVSGTFSPAVTSAASFAVTNLTNQLVLGTTNLVTINSPAPAGAVTLTLPNTTDTLVGRATTDTLTNKTLTSPVMTAPALGTPASGVMTNVTGVPAAAILAGSFGAGAFVISTSLQSATYELGHATDTTLSRVSAGLIAVEGVNVVDVSTAQTLTNKTLTSPILTTPNLGTPSALVLTSATGLPTAGLVDAAVTSAKMSAGAKTNTVVIPVPDPGAANADISAGYVLWKPSVAVTITKVYLVPETAYIAAASANDASVVVSNAAVGVVSTLAIVTALAAGSINDTGAITNPAVVADTNVTIAVTTNGTADAPRQNIQIEYTTTN